MPAYFAKVIQIDAIMQISSAFAQVQGALSYIVNSYADLAAWHGVVRSPGDSGPVRCRTLQPLQIEV